MTTSPHAKQKAVAVIPDPAVPAAFYSMNDLRRRCGTPTRPASRSKVYRMIAAGIVPAALKDLNAWSAVAVDAALARLDQCNASDNQPRAAALGTAQDFGRRRRGDAQ